MKNLNFESRKIHFNLNRKVGNLLESREILLGFDSILSSVNLRICTTDEELYFQNHFRFFHDSLIVKNPVTKRFVECQPKPEMNCGNLAKVLQKYSTKRRPIRNKENKVARSGGDQVSLTSNHF